MIVQPDFLDHWKTVLLCDLLNDQRAPIYIIRLWAHCQNRKISRFKPCSANMLKAICKAPQDAAAFFAAMFESGFVELDGEELVVHDWDDVNSSLVKSWDNGKRGGRPKKSKPSNNPAITQPKPSDNPEPVLVNPGETDKRREDKRREETLGKGASETFELQFSDMHKAVLNLWTEERKAAGKQTYTDRNTTEGIAAILETGASLGEIQGVMRKALSDEWWHDKSLSAIAKNFGRISDLDSSTASKDVPYPKSKQCCGQRLDSVQLSATSGIMRHTCRTCGKSWKLDAKGEILEAPTR